MNINPKIFKAYDIRGIYPIDINEENIQLIIRGIYTFFVKKLGKEVLTIVIGRDMRLSSPSLAQTAIDELVKLGAVVIDIGLSSTPTVYFAILEGKFDAGIQISASHNPKDYNGLKFAYRVKNTLVKVSKITGMDDVKTIVTTNSFNPSKKSGSIITKQDILDKEIRAALNDVKPTHIKPIKVVADAANAMGSLYLDKLFKKLPCSLVPMNFKLDGTFPAHQADPLDFDNLKDLQKRVVAENADLGIEPDGDGDRVFFVNEKGEVIPATLISSLIAKELLQKNPGEKILVDIRYTRNVLNVCKKNNGKVSICKIGHALITEQLNRENAIFAGESSGHFYFRKTGGAESSLRVILIVLEVMGRENKPISQILAELQTSYESGEYNFILKEGITSEDVTNTILKSYKDGKVSKLDGIAVDFPEWRYSIRSSNTEPLLRLNVEGTTQELVDVKRKELEQYIVRLGAKPKK